MSSPAGASNAGSTSGATSGNVRTPPDILTYRYGNEMVYVTRGETYEASPSLETIFFFFFLILAALLIGPLGSHRFCSGGLSRAQKGRS